MMCVSNICHAEACVSYRDNVTKIQYYKSMLEYICHFSDYQIVCNLNSAGIHMKQCFSNFASHAADVHVTGIIEMKNSVWEDLAIFMHRYCISNCSIW